MQVNAFIIEHAKPECQNGYGYSHLRFVGKTAKYLLYCEYFTMIGAGCIEYDEYVLPRVAVPVIIVYICMQKYIIKGMTYRPHGSCIRTAVPQKRDSDWR